MEQKDYVAGFLFRNNNTEVALIRKNKPDWQRGRLNGIGGKVEAGETPQEAMEREFEEEAGATVKWTKFIGLLYPPATIDFFVSHDGDGVDLKSLTSEAVGWFRVDDLQNEVTLPNLRWLIPLALDETGLIGNLIGR